MFPPFLAFLLDVVCTFYLLQAANVLSNSCIANACLIPLQSLQLSSEAYFVILDRHGRTPAWYRDFWKQPVLLPLEREPPAWMPADKSKIRVAIRLLPSRKLMEGLAADRLERAESGVRSKGLGAGAEANKVSAEQSGGSGNGDESSAALGGVGGGEEERRAAAKRAKRAQKKKRKNGAAENLEVRRVGKAGALAPVGEFEALKASLRYTESILAKTGVAIDSAGHSESLKALGGFVAESEGAPSGSQGAAAKDTSGEEGVVQADAAAPQSGSEAQRSLASTSGAWENQGGAEIPVDWSKMTPQQIGDHLREKQWSEKDVQSLEWHVSLAKHLLGVGEVAYARFVAHFKEKEREHDGRVFDPVAFLLRRLDTVSRTILIDLVAESVKESTESKQKYVQQVQSGICSFDNLRPWVLCTARVALLQAASIRKLFSDLQCPEDDTIRSALSFARSEVRKARVLVSNLRWSHPLELQGFIALFETETVRGQLDWVDKVGLVKDLVGDEADAKRARLSFLDKAVVALEATVVDMGMAHISVSHLANFGEVRSSCNCLLLKKFQSHAFHTESQTCKFFCR
jgi:hypothetical protein